MESVFRTCELSTGLLGRWQGSELFKPPHNDWGETEVIARVSAVTDPVNSDDLNLLSR